MYKVEISSQAERDMKRLAANIFDRIVPEIRALAQNPRPQGCVKLAGSKHDYRIRIGDYRVLVVKSPGPSPNRPHHARPPPSRGISMTSHTETKYVTCGLKAVLRLVRAATSGWLRTNKYASLVSTQLLMAPTAFLSHGQFSILNPVRLIGFATSACARLLIAASSVPLEEDHLRITLECQDVGREAVEE